MTLGRRLAALAVALPLLACQATAQVAVSTTPGGGGTLAVSLVLDAQAAARLDLASALQVGDLQRAGWQLVAPVTARNGSVTVTVRHPFHDPAQATALLGTLGAPLHLTLTRRRGLVSDRLALAGTVDLRGGVDAFADDRLRSSLGLTSLASALAGLQRAGATTPTMDVQVVSDLPGRPRQVAGGGQVRGDTVTWTVPLGAVAVIGASTSSTDTTAEHWLEAAGALLVALAIAVVWEVRARRQPDAWAVPAGSRRRP
jgi:hypothetical protein